MKVIALHGSQRCALPHRGIVWSLVNLQRPGLSVAHELDIPENTS